jgi:sulfite exporter TauE/SafE
VTALLTGLALGLAGGAHCAAMCGPLVAAVAPSGWRAVVHHGSRTITYVLLGGIAGLAGTGASAVGLGRVVSWLAAAALLVQAIAPLFGTRISQRARVGQAVFDLVARTRGIARRHPIGGAVLFGAMNGLLPCGLVYSATIASLGLGGVTSGMAFMLGFAGGTTAILAPAGALWTRLAGRFPRPAARLGPVALTLVACLLIVRGWTAGVAMPHH